MQNPIEIITNPDQSQTKSGISQITSLVSFLKKFSTLTNDSCPPTPFLELVPDHYDFESHEVVTKDGYILQLFRLRDKNRIK